MAHTLFDTDPRRPAQAGLRLFNVGPSRRHVAARRRLEIQPGRFLRQPFDQANGVYQRHRLGGAQIDRGIAERPQPGDRPAGNVVDVGKVSALRSIALHHHRLALADPLREAEQAHVRLSGRAIDREIAEHGDV